MVRKIDEYFKGNSIQKIYEGVFNFFFLENVICKFYFRCNYFLIVFFVNIYFVVYLL